MSTDVNKVQGLAKTMMVADHRRYVVLLQGLLAVAVGWTLANAFELVWRGIGIPRFNPFGVHDATWAATLVAGAALVYTLRNPVWQDFANEVAIELRKVSWPTAKETRQSTIVVIVCVVVVSVILGSFDLIWSKLIKFLLTYGAS